MISNVKHRTSVNVKIECNSQTTEQFEDINYVNMN